MISSAKHLCFLRGGLILASAIAFSGTAFAQQDAAQPSAAPVAPPSATPSPAPGTVQQIPAPLPLPALNDAQAAQLRDFLSKAATEQGLRHENAARALPQNGDGLVRAALDYARAVRTGRLDKSDFQEDWALRPAAYDPLPAFSEAVAADRLTQWIRSLPPPWAGYDALQAGLTRYRAIETAGGWEKIPAGPDMKVGSRGPRVAALRKRLAVEDDSVSVAGETFDEELKQAVIRAQRRYGLNPTGTVSTGTMTNLNVPIAERIDQIMANMERWRWLPAELPAKRIQVNIAAAVLTVFEGDEAIASMKAVTGRPGNETPMLQSTIHSIVLNPPWNVPTSIANKELWPKGEAALKAQGYRIIGTGSNRRLQQQPGPRSALGLYKFDFDNNFAVYLHDTPSQSTFSTYSRLESHGCIRLEKPRALAELLFRNDAEWQPEQLKAELDKGKTKRVRLKEEDQVQVYLLYWTAFANPNGTMSFRNDPYGWDKKLAAKIARRSELSAAEMAAR